MKITQSVDERQPTSKAVEHAPTIHCSNVTTQLLRAQPQFGLQYRDYLHSMQNDPTMLADADDIGR